MKKVSALVLVLLWSCLFLVQAQNFKVSSFRLLETDLTARVQPVMDLNNDPCALIKVVMDKNFEFSGPLGIVKRIDKTAEIWIYVPTGTESLTISHPQWGMIRDYRLPMELVGKSTYEMRLEAIKQEEYLHVISIAEVRSRDLGPPIPSQPSSENKSPIKIKKGMALMPVANISSVSSYGVMITYLARLGGYVKYESNWKVVKDDGLSCNSSGVLSDGSGTPYYSGKVYEKRYDLCAGMVYGFNQHIFMNLGFGYGNQSKYWETIEGKKVLVTDISYKGLTVESGLIVRFNFFSATLGVQSLQLKKTGLILGAGIAF